MKLYPLLALITATSPPTPAIPPTPAGEPQEDWSKTKELITREKDIVLAWLTNFHPAVQT